MAGCIFENVVVSGLACASPVKRVFADEYEQYFGKDVIEQFKKATGIESRYLSNGKQTASDLCYVAARELMRHKGLNGQDIDALVFITQTADYKTPATAFVLHKRLEIKKECVVFDINLGCSAFVNGLYVLAGMIQSGSIERALLLVGDAELEHPIYEDKSFTMMFGDAGSACLLERGKGNIRGMIKADGTGYNTLTIPCPGARFPHGLDEVVQGDAMKKMDGDDTFLFTITEVPRLFKEFFKQYDLSWDDFDYCILHQANLMILNHIAKRIKLPVDKMPISLDKYGNTDGTTIPIGIVDLCEKLRKDSDIRLVVSGFGIGLSWGIMAFDIRTKDVLPMIFTDEYYAEGYII